MGRAHSKVGYAELRSSLPGGISTFSSTLHPAPDQIFYVVVTGEVVVTLSSDDLRNTPTNTFGPGEVIHFFGASLHGLSAECFRNDAIGGKLTLQFKSGMHKETGKST
eukprot:CAMPEP_0173297164 /NCGR_PEP_ID=MMETSP1143-20121109/15361_1 /TAXON_ID=483371 /ORGANISM="non described non described, Strain CCMP2298" /LENGTH=107 /DNA_ID=CAMNT_0014237091 /DNA_START=449 /DNA_END=769 /DNA_ORIENTATION=+